MFSNLETMSYVDLDFQIRLTICYNESRHLIITVLKIRWGYQVFIVRHVRLG